jgi:hypothetical protein
MKIRWTCSVEILSIFGINPHPNPPPEYMGRGKGGDARRFQRSKMDTDEKPNIAYG